MIEKKELVWSPTLNRWIEQLTFTTDNLGGVVYREGAASSGFVYSNFADAVKSIKDSGVPAILYVDGTLGNPTVPAGTYDLSLVTLSEFPGRFNDSLNLQDGARFDPAPSIIDEGLSLYSYSNSPIIDQPSLTLYLKNGSWLQTVGSGPFIHVGTGALAQVFLTSTSYLAGSLAGSTAPIISSDASSTFTGINVENWCDVGENALDGYGSMEVNLTSSSASIEAQPHAHALTIVLGSLASAESYSPAHDGYWAPQPTTVAAALDQLAENASSVSVGTGNEYALFFALMPGDNSATVAVGGAVQFPQNGPTSGTILRTGASTFKLAVAGTYEIAWQVSVNEPGQLQLAIGGVGLPNTVVGSATGTRQLSGNTLIKTLTVNNILSLINPIGNSTALTVTPIAGGASSVSATLLIKLL